MLNTTCPTRKAPNALRRRGFTLIELLIVVAIIALLAAIAVPNFLEAQTRAKVSRVQSDMRTIAFALEAYAVEWNAYPLYGAVVGTAPAAQVQDPATSTGGDYFEFLSRHPKFAVSTPVAYLQSIPSDLFATRYAGLGPEPVFRDFAYKNARFNAALFVGTPEPWLGSGGSAFIRDWGGWRLASAGPDLVRTVDIKLNIVYDASNGTVSRGDIVRSQRTAESRPK